MQLQVETTIYKDGAIGGDIANTQALTRAKYAVCGTAANVSIKEAELTPSVSNWSLFAGMEILAEKRHEMKEKDNLANMENKF